MELKLLPDATNGIVSIRDEAGYEIAISDKDELALEIVTKFNAHAELTAQVERDRLVIADLKCKNTHLNGVMTRYLGEIEDYEKAAYLACIVKNHLIDALQGALVDDLLKYHSPEWIDKARKALVAAGCV